MKIPQLEKLIQTLRVKTGLEDLAMRERMSLLAGALLILGVIFFQFIISPYLDARSRLQSTIQRKEGELADIRLLKEEFAELRLEEGGIKANLAERAKSFTLFTFIDQQAEKSGVKPQINYMKPSVLEGEGDLNESVVELKLQEVTLENLVKFMELTESETNVVYIRRVSIQTSAKKQGYLDVILQIVTFVKAG